MTLLKHIGNQLGLINKWGWGQFQFLVMYKFQEWNFYVNPETVCVKVMGKVQKFSSTKCDIPLSESCLGGTHFEHQLGTAVRVIYVLVLDA